MLCPKLSSESKLIWVAAVVCLPIVALRMFLSPYLIIFHGSNYEFSWGEQLFQWGIAASICIGSYVGISSLNSE